MSMPVDGIVLECNNLKKTFFKNKKGIEVLNGISLTLESGKIYIVRGRSGVGKSTFINLLCGLDSATSGSIRIGDTDIVNLSNSKLAELRKNSIGIIFQNFNLISSWTAYENVEAALLFTGIGRTERDGKIRALLTDMGLGDRMDNLPSELSAGQQQRVAIARALINEPILILADEPTGDLDPETAKEIVQLLLNFVSKNITVLITTHGSFPPGIGDIMFEMVDGFLKPAV